MNRTSQYYSIAILSITLLCLTASCKVGRFIIYNVSDIRDYKKFPDRKLKKPATPFYFTKADSVKAPKSITIDKKGAIPFDKYLEKHKTVAFIIIRNDSIEYEKYFNGYTQANIVPSFSMAKSITSLLIGCAIEDGLIRSVQDPVTDYIPEMKQHGFDKVTIENLLQMASGLKFNEGYYNPFGQVASFYYGKTLRKSTERLKLAYQPGTKFEYKSGNTEILGLILERALKTKTITEYLEEKLWQPLGMQYDASWSIDKKENGLEKTFCCVNATAIDFAKIGSLMLHKGKWNGKQLVPAQWITQSTKTDTANGSAWFYQYQWWLPTRNGDYYADGHLGQYIYVNPAKHLVMVRLGKNTGGINWPQLFVSLAEAY